MTRRLDPSALADAVRNPGFTPAIRDADALFGMLGDPDEDLAKSTERALLRIGPGLVRVAAASSLKAEAPLRARLCRLIGKLEGEEAAAFLLGAVNDPDPKTRRNALVALGRVRTPEAEAALVDAWASETRVEQLRSIAASLGKIGTAGALAAKAHPHDDLDDPELRRLIARARTALGRDAKRTLPSAIDATVAPPHSMPLIFRCREGLEELLAEELDGEWKPRVRGPGEVVATLHGPLTDAFRARIAVEFGFAMAKEPVRGEGDRDGALVRALTNPRAREVFRTFTRGIIRYRLAWAEGGHHRARVWAAAQNVSSVAPELVNDPTESTWEVRVTEEETEVKVELYPRALLDPRFAYRVADVPAASHPTIAAALVRAAGVRADDIVWDPFVGSGSELIERALAGPYAALHGSDLDSRALVAARKNLDAAGVRAELREGDALTHSPRGTTLIITNPPMGRRVSNQGELAPFLDRFLAHAASVLVPGGRLVWISPQPGRTRAGARACGLEITKVQKISMGTREQGGFTAEIQTAVRRDDAMTRSS